MRCLPMRHFEPAARGRTRYIVHIKIATHNGGISTLDERSRKPLPVPKLVLVRVAMILIDARSRQNYRLLTSCF